MNYIYGLSSLFLFISALDSIKTENYLWIFANFYIIYTSFMYNIHKFDLYERFTDKIHIADISDKYDIYLFNDYIAVSLLAFLNIDNLILRNVVFLMFLAEYYYHKSIEKSNTFVFSISILSRTLKTLNTYQKYSIDNQVIYIGVANIIHAFFTLIIRQTYSYRKETRLLNVILTAIWHYNVINILCCTSSCMYSELHNNITEQ